MRRVLIGILAAGCWVSSYATDARVVTMGRHDAFFMDEASVFRNPANMNIYPNMVYGSYGVFKPNSVNGYVQDSTGSNATNKDPDDPFFGSIISYSLNQGTDNATQYPMISFGAFFNRHDDMLDYLTPGNKRYVVDAMPVARPTDRDSVNLPEPVGKIDLLLGYVLKNGAMIGGGGYFATQKATVNGKETQASIIKGNLGVNWPIAKSMDLDVSIGGGQITAIADSSGKPRPVADHNNFFRLEGRLFSALSLINGDFVPHVRVDALNLKELDISSVDLAAGIGLNVNIDKGFFWAGLEFLWGQNDAVKTTSEKVGGRVSFGIERNIFWDWFVIRVGGMKELVYINNGPESGHLEENRPSDASDNDLVSLGFGINVDNRLRIDFVAAEDFAYTFGNLISKQQTHLFNRVSATYSF
jgi:hypothetical protein